MFKLKSNIIVFSVLAMLIVSGCTNIYENGKDLASVSKTKIKSITVKELKTKFEAEEEFLLIDVRQYNEYHKGNIEGSSFISRGDLELKILNDE
ncbi:MAG: rhodanese-like domain-containing protein, partial [Bacteroidota bacterium]|nr:rhodanese-like domain-containing protein [Bacteroidota bacterium]